MVKVSYFDDFIKVHINYSNAIDLNIKKPDSRLTKSVDGVLIKKRTKIYDLPCGCSTGSVSRLSSAPPDVLLPQLCSPPRQLSQYQLEFKHSRWKILFLINHIKSMISTDNKN